MGQSETVQMGIIAKRSAIAQAVGDRWASRGLGVIEIKEGQAIPDKVAGLAIDPGSPIDEGSMDLERFRGTLQEAVKARVARVGIISSALTMAREEGGGRVFDESFRPVPGDEVRGSAMERAVWREGELYRWIAKGLDAVMINPTVVVGEEQWGEELELIAGTLEGVLLPALLEGVEVGVVRQSDVAQALVVAMDRGRRGRRYLVSGGEMEVGKALEALVEGRGGRVPRRRWNAQRFIRATNWIPDCELKERLLRLAGMDGQRRLVEMRGRGRGERCAGELMVEPLDVGPPETVLSR